MLSYHILKEQSIKKTIDRFFVAKEYAKFDIDKNRYTDLFFNTLKHNLITYENEKEEMPSNNISSFIRINFLL